MKEAVAVIDGGGRGSVLVEKNLQSDHVKKVVFIPGNDWARKYQELYCKEVLTFPDVKTTHVEKIAEICRQEKVSLVTVAQENAIEAGLVDKLIKEKIPTLGPTKKAGEVEWNKVFTRHLLQDLGINQPKFEVFDNEEAGLEYVLFTHNYPLFIKAAGLCEGKGAIGVKNKKQGVDAILKMRKFGDAGKTFLVEEWLKGDNNEPGVEFSAFALTDGENIRFMGTAKDYKQVYNFSEGENTGGMGSISPHSYLNDKLNKSIENIFEKVINKMVRKKRPYRGILYMGGMLVKKGDELKPFVIEFNARWGDPEAQSIIPGIQNDFYELGKITLKNKLGGGRINHDNLIRVVIAGVSRGYPNDYSKVLGKEIIGIDEAEKISGVKIFGAGMRIIDGKYYVNGGRLFYVVGEGKDIISARKKAYFAINQIHIPEIDLHYRTDIAIS